MDGRRGSPSAETGDRRRHRPHPPDRQRARGRPRVQAVGRPGPGALPGGRHRGRGAARQGPGRRRTTGARREGRPRIRRVLLGGEPGPPRRHARRVGRVERDTRRDGPGPGVRGVQRRHRLPGRRGPRQHLERPDQCPLLAARPGPVPQAVLRSALGCARPVRAGPARLHRGSRPARLPAPRHRRGHRGRRRRDRLEGDRGGGSLAAGGRDVDAVRTRDGLHGPPGAPPAPRP